MPHYPSKYLVLQPIKSENWLDFLLAILSYLFSIRHIQMQKREVSDLYGILTLYYFMCVRAHVYVHVHVCMCLKMLLHVFLQHSTSHIWKHILSIEPSTFWLSYLLSQGSSISAFMPFWHLPECRISKLQFVYLSVKHFSHQAISPAADILMLKLFYKQ